MIIPFPKRQILDSSKLEELADNNFKFTENDREFSIRVENTGKRRNCLLRAISPFPTVFSKDLYCRLFKTRACLGKGYTCSFINPFPNKPWFLHVCSTSLLKIVREKEKLFVTSNFSFSHSIFYLVGELSVIFNKLEIVVCKLSVWKSL